MLSRQAFYERLAICQNCSEWDGVCLRGHALQSPTGCPMRKFAPILNTAYDEDRGRVVAPPGQKTCCGSKPVDPNALPELTWAEVLQHLADSMAQWRESGFATVSHAEHKKRHDLCKACPQYVGYRCKLCQCVAYSKAKLATEYCPLGGW
jgi:hypothetical protein